MATLTVWRFSDAYSADKAISTLKELSKLELIKVHDGAIVSWELGAKKPKTKQLNDMTGPGALGGAFWGLLFGLLFFVPLLGLAVGAASGAIAGSLTDVGIDDKFVKRIREQITPGTSALFVMTSDAVMDRVHQAFVGQFEGQAPELIYTNMSNEQEKALRETFAE